MDVTSLWKGGDEGELEDTEGRECDIEHGDTTLIRTGSFVGWKRWLKKFLMLGNGQRAATSASLVGGSGKINRMWRNFEKDGGRRMREVKIGAIDGHTIMRTRTADGRMEGAVSMNED